MLSPQGRALLTLVQDQLIELYVEQDEAREDKDRARVGQLQVEIDRLRHQCDLIRRAD